MNRVATLVAALDVGTTGVKCVIVDPRSGVVASAYVEQRLRRPAPDRVEQDPAVLGRAIDRAVSRAVRDGRHAGSVAAVAVTGARATFVGLDHAGRPATPFLIWQDQRAAGVGRDLGATVRADRYFELTGLPLGPVASAAKMHWLADREPATWAGVSRIATAPGYALMALGAPDSVAPPSAAAYVGLLDIRSRTWSKELIEAFGLAAGVLPTVVPEGAIVGSVSAVAAERTGLARGTPLVAAPSDWASTLAGCAAVEPGDAVAYLGTGGALGVVVAGPVLDPRSGLSCLPTIGEGRAALEGLLITGAAPYRWYRDLLTAFDRDDTAAGDGYARLERLARTSPPGSRGVLTLPTFAGSGAPNPEPNARAVILGIGLDTSSGDLVRSLIEGVALDLRELLDVVDAAGTPVRRLALTGPPAGSALWGQIVADALSIVVGTVHPSDPTTIGAAAVASAALASGASPRSGAGRGGVPAAAVAAVARRLTRRGRTYRPRPGRTGLYDDLLGIRRSLAGQLRDSGTNARLAALRGGLTGPTSTEGG